MEGLFAEIARKRKERDEKASASASASASKRKNSATTTTTATPGPPRSPSPTTTTATPGPPRSPSPPPSLDQAEVQRRLRLLKQPATLFGENHAERYARLKKVEREMVVEDTYAVGQQANTILEIQREEEFERQRMLRKEAQEKKESQSQSQIVRYTPEDEVERTRAAFKAAAERIAAEQREKEMCVEDALLSYLKRKMAEWESDLESRPDDFKRSGDGKQAMLQYRTTAKSFLVLYERIEQRSLADDIKASLWLMVKSLKERNYLHAQEIYVRLAIGNAPWPIGVTSVGIHDRSAREKISFSMNGQAHIMNDEATRKFMQGFKRLMSWIAEQSKKRGEVLHLAPAPRILGKSGSKWENVLKHSGV